MIIRIIFVCLLLISVSACESPLAPDQCGIFEEGTVGETSIVYCGDVNIVNPTEGSADAEDRGVVKITLTHTNDSGRAIYRIGPGSSFMRVNGNADSVWCKPSSDCNDVSRTQINVTGPPSQWISGMHAEFRRSGDSGNYVVFRVDGETVNHTF